jgi:hypothetical protein
VWLYLDVEIFGAEYVLKRFSRSLRPFLIVISKIVAEHAASAATEADQPRASLRKQIHVDPRLVMKTVGIGL